MGDPGPRKAPGKCYATLLPAIIMTLFYGLPRYGWDTFRSRRAAR
jgi:hypothetical protein